MPISIDEEIARIDAQLNDLLIPLKDEFNENIDMTLINESIINAHNQNSVDTSVAPNTNIIYKVYDDGTITREKGGNAYGRRSKIELDNAIVKIENISDNIFFPCGLIKGHKYIMTTNQECAVELRQKLIQIYSEIGSVIKIVAFNIEKDISNVKILITAKTIYENDFCTH